MKKSFLILLFAVCANMLWAGNPGFGDRRYSLTVMGEYAYNEAWQHHGNLDVQALMPINPHFEMALRSKFSCIGSSWVCKGCLVLRPLK